MNVHRTILKSDLKLMRCPLLSGMTVMCGCISYIKESDLMMPIDGAISVLAVGVALITRIGPRC